MEGLSEAVLRAPASAEGRRLFEWLRRNERTGEGWERLIEVMLPHADRVAWRFHDVIDLDEARNEYAERLYEKWTHAWIDAVARDREVSPFAVFTSDRFYDALRAMRRKRRRRREKEARHLVGVGSNRALVEVEDVGDGYVNCRTAWLPAVMTAEMPLPDERLRLRDALELIWEGDAVPRAERSILTLLARGWTQKEIAAHLQIHEVALSRKVSDLRSLLQRLLLGPGVEPR